METLWSLESLVVEDAFASLEAELCLVDDSVDALLELLILEL
jgi:hypothetical protein